MIFRRFKDRKGWTLMELMLVIGIIGIMGALAIPGYLAGMPLRRLKADAMDIASNMKYAKMKAVQRNIQVGLYVNSGGTAVNGVDPSAYGVYEDSGATANQFDSTDSRLKVSIALRGGIQFDTGNANWDVTNNTIIFRPNGSAITSTTVVISNGSQTRSIVVANITGKVQIQ